MDRFVIGDSENSDSGSRRQGHPPRGTQGELPAPAYTLVWLLFLTENRTDASSF
jgi:hypothetical protein